VGHVQLLGHGLAVEALRAALPASAQVGIVLNLTPTEPAGDSQADAEAAERDDGFYNRWFLDPLFRGRYPDDMLTWFGDAAPKVLTTDFATISAPIDYLGINYYQRAVVAYEKGAAPTESRRIIPPGQPVTAGGWEVYPPGLATILTRVHEDYAPAALYVMENGAAFNDRVVDGAVNDPERESFIHQHLLQVHEVIEAEVPVRGYFVWSLLDNFEWNKGYALRFGLVHVDFKTQERIIKRSGHWYADAASENGIPG
jgi:beta-glucosidase